MMTAVATSVPAEIEAAAHMLLEDNPEATVAATDAFLNSHYAA
jgi:hypothetical protein